jgi:predicted metal-dependent hydrolase
MSLFAKSKKVLAQAWKELLNIWKEGLLKLKGACLAQLARLVVIMMKPLEALLQKLTKK